MNFIVFDTESNSLAYDSTRIHIMCWLENNVISHTNDINVMAEVFRKPDTFFVCHNAITFDKVLLQRFGIEIPLENIIDSLALSWYLWPTRPKHGLASWGDEFKVPKPDIDDWENLTYEQYLFRCSEDVKINSMLWNKELESLIELYDGWDQIYRLIKYVNFKMDCLREQEQYGCTLDYEKALQHRDTLAKIVDQKCYELSKAMPAVPIVKKKSRPKKMTKQDGSLSALAMNWYDDCIDQGKCPETTTEIEIISGYEDPNPGSHVQVKKWLFDLGWQPCTYKYVRESRTEVRQIPQVRHEGELTDSVKALIPRNPSVGILDGLTVAQHRKSIFDGMIETAQIRSDGTYRVTAGAHAFTNTLRLCHRKPLVNLPGVDKPWGKEVREVLVGSLVGCDLVSLEDTTKRHYMMNHDPAYVAEQEAPGYDPHLSLAKYAGLIDQDQYDTYDGQPELKAIRTAYKVTNYSALYGIQATALSRTLGCEKKEAQGLLDAFWEKNWSIEVIANECFTKKAVRQRWLFNPVSGFWYTLRTDKDRFSTLNQSTGVYVFDSFLACVRAAGIVTVGQFHDEFIGLNMDPNQTKQILDQACENMNQFLNLNVRIKYDCEFGNNYSEVH